MEILVLIGMVVGTMIGTISVARPRAASGSAHEAAGMVKFNQLVDDIRLVLRKQSEDARDNGKIRSFAIRNTSQSTEFEVYELR